MPGPAGAIDAIESFFGGQQPGQAKPAPVAPGQAEIARLQSATKPDGSPAFSSQDIAKYQRDTSLTLMHAGFSVQQIEAHWGVQPPSSPQVAAHVANNIHRSGIMANVWGAVTDATAAFEAGWGTSVTGIGEHIATGQNPNKAFQVKPDPGLINGIAQASGQVLGDLPASILGFFGGATAGAAVGGGAGVVGGAAVPVAGETGVSEVAGGGAGAVVGALAGGGFGAGAAPQATREVLLDAYNRGQIHSFSDFLHVAGASTLRTLKAGAESLPFGLAGPIAGKLGELGAKPIVAAVGGAAAATAAGVSTGAALDGRMPDAKDFVTAAATMLIAHGAVKAGVVAYGVFKPSAATLNVQNNLEEIYRRNGTTPWEAINAAKGDPGLRQEILQQDVNGNSVAPRMHANAPQEPPPVKPQGEPAAEKEAPPAASEPEIGSDAGNGYVHGPNGNRVKVSTDSFGGLSLQKRKGGAASAFYVGVDGKLLDADSIDRSNPYSVARIWKGEPDQKSAAAEVLSQMSTKGLKDPARKALAETLRKLVTGEITPEEAKAGAAAKEDFVTARQMLFGKDVDKPGAPVHGPFTEYRVDADGNKYLKYRANNGEELPVKLGIEPDGTAEIAIDQFSNKANRLGPAEVRQAMQQLQEMYPEIKSFGGYRRSGAGKGRVQEVTPPPRAAPIVTSFEDLLTALEGSRDDQVSPAGAIGKHQIMVGTARQYGFGNGMSQAELAQWLHDPTNNGAVFHRIASDLHQRFHGDMNAMLIAYNAGPGRAGEYMKAGPGTELEAIPDRTARGGIRYESVPSQRDESFLPMETQKYLANGRRRSGGVSEAAEGAQGGSRALTVFPSDSNHAELEESSGGSGGGKEPPPPGDEPPDDNGPGGDGYWTKAPYGHAVDEIMANIGEPPKPPSLLDPDRMMEQYVSELTPARNIDTGLVREGGFDRNRDVGQEDMFRQTYASDTRTGAFVRFGVLKIEGNEIRVVPDSASMMKATDEVRKAGGDMRGWTAYMLARRTLDKDRQGIRTGFNLGASTRVATGPDAAKYEQATATFNKVMDGGLEYGRDSGLFSQSQIEAMQRDNPAYISMRRIMGDNESFGTGKGRGFGARDPLRQMEGSDRQIVDPIKAAIDNLRVIVAMSDRNRAIGSIIGQVEAGRLEGLGLEKQGEVTISAGPDDPFKPYNVDGKDADATYGSLLAERSQKGLGPNEFIYYRNGVAERWTAKNPALVTLMRKSVGPGEANIIGKTFDRIAALDRAGVVLDPAFPTRVTLRHQVTAFIADPLHPPPFLTWLSGIHDVLTQNGVFQNWIANGGAGTALADMDVKWLQRDMETVFQDQGIFSRMWNTVKHPLEAYQFVSERIDAAARVGYYKQALDSGRSPLKSATMSRKAMLDYAERASLPAVNSIARKVPFLRPKILGIKMFAENFADRPASTAAYGAAGVLGFTVAAVTIPTLALYAANYLADKSLPDNEKYSSIPRWIRDTHYITPPIAGARVQFPYPFVVGTVFGGLVNRFLDSWVKSDPHAFDQWAHSTLSDYNPFEMMPTALKTPIESVANYNFMSGHAVVPSSVEAADGYMQYTNATTEPAKALSRYLGPPGLNLANFSPMQTEHWIDGWTGPVGIGILRAVNGRMTDYKPPHQMADIPVAGTFFVRNPDMHAQQIEDFYTDLKAMEAAHADWALALKHGDEGEIASAARGPFYGLRIVGKIASALHIQAAAVSAVNNDKTLRPEEKSQAVDQILSSMIQLSVMGSGVTATLQGKEPSSAFKELDKSGAMATATAAAAQ